LWFIIFGVLSLGLIGFSIYTRNLMTIITFVLISVIALFFALQRPQLVTFKLTSTGISANRIFYPYRNIKKFWIVYGSQAKALHFETIAYLNSQVSLELGKQDPLEVRQFLKKYLPEDLDKEEPFADILARRLKF